MCSESETVTSRQEIHQMVDQLLREPGITEAGLLQAFQMYQPRLRHVANGCRLDQELLGLLLARYDWSDCLHASHDRTKAIPLLKELKPSTAELIHLEQRAKAMALGRCLAALWRAHGVLDESPASHFVDQYMQPRPIRQPGMRVRTSTKDSIRVFTKSVRGGWLLPPRSD